MNDVVNDVGSVSKTVGKNVGQYYTFFDFKVSNITLRMKETLLIIEININRPVGQNCVNFSLARITTKNKVSGTI